MKEISVSSKETTASQIKGEKQLSDLTDSVQLISEEIRYQAKISDEIFLSGGI